MTAPATHCYHRYSVLGTPGFPVICCWCADTISGLTEGDRKAIVRRDQSRALLAGAGHGPFKVDPEAHHARG